MTDIIKIAAVQTNPRLMDPETNLINILNTIREAVVKQANLIVFPECSLSGYVFHSRKEALPYADTIPGPTTEKLTSLCSELNVYVILGLLEKEKDKLFNVATFVGPEGIVGNYRKNHLPFLGVDRFADHGDKPFKVYQTPVGNIGIEICYDIVFPESSRVMVLQGADILVVPTNFPTERTEDVIKYVIPTRAFENTVYVVAADRVGTERDCSFAGKSKIVDTTGKILCTASADREEIIYAEVNLATAREKHLITVPCEHETDRIKDRRPELYGVITEPINVKIPGKPASN